MAKFLSALSAFQGSSSSSNQTSEAAGPGTPDVPSLSVIDMFFPGFSVVSALVKKYLGIDITLYIPLLLLWGGMTFAWRYISSYFWDLAETYLMSVCELRTDDELYYQVLSWVAAQRFAQKSRRFFANSSISGRYWFLWSYDDDDGGDGDDYEPTDQGYELSKKKNPLSYTPSFGSHSFWYKGWLLRFTRTENRDQSAWLSASEKEEISISCFGRNPRILKELLLEARREHLKKDEKKTFIYRGTTKTNGGGEASWQRSMARTPRPFSTVILDDKVKKDLISDLTDYLDPNTRRWYSNRGIPYRRGYLLYGPPGTGKSSFSLALAGYFKMRIYIVSLNSVTASEENLSCLFAELPKRCVVLLEDIDTAGLTHTREDRGADSDADDKDSSSSGERRGNKATPGMPQPQNNSSPRLSLSGLLNILDGVASQEGRILIMTTNHLEKLDKALIRPGRVDMTVKFGLADKGVSAAIFRAIFAPMDVDAEPETALTGLETEKERERVEELARKRSEKVEKIAGLADVFAAKIPENEFSPAELQGFLLKHKRDPDTVVATAEEWVVTTRKEKREKEAKESAEKKKKAEEDAKKKKEEEEAEKKKKEKRKAKKKQARSGKKDSKPGVSSDDDSGSGSDSDSSSAASSSDSDSSSEDEREARKKRRSKRRPVKVSKAKLRRNSTIKDDGEAAAAAPAQPGASGTDKATETAQQHGPSAPSATLTAADEPAAKTLAPKVDTENVALEKGDDESRADSGYGSPAGDRLSQADVGC